MELLRLLSIFASVLVIIALRRRRRHTLPLPPGPKGFPLLGLLTRPTTKLPGTYTEWGKKFGELVHFEVLDHHTIVLNSEKAASELLEKRAAITSDRPSSHSSVGMLLFIDGYT